MSNKYNGCLFTINDRVELFLFVRRFGLGYDEYRFKTIVGQQELLHPRTNSVGIQESSITTWLNVKDRDFIYKKYPVFRD